jgi:hypothetical protein
MAVGAMLGGAVLGVGLFAASEAVEHVVGDHALRWLAGAAVAVLLTGDLWSIILNRLYPWGPRRQTSQMLMFRWQRASTIGFAWGLDAGTGVTTYRVTSGVWVTAVLVITGLVPAWVAVAYGVGFGISLVAIVVWPVHRVGDEPASEAAVRRVRRLAPRRRLVQASYVLLAIGAVTTVCLL